MQVLAVVREDQVRRDLRLEVLEKVLDRAAVVWKEAVAELADDDVPAGGPVEERLGAAVNLLGARVPRAEHHPPHLDRRKRLDQMEDRSAATDLDVVGVATHGEDTVGRRRLAERQLQHGHDDPSASRGTPFLSAHTSQGGCPVAASVSSLCLSFSVSIGSQKPS